MVFEDRQSLWMQVVINTGFTVQLQQECSLLGGCPFFRGALAEGPLLEVPLNKVSGFHLRRGA